MTLPAGSQGVLSACRASAALRGRRSPTQRSVRTAQARSGPVRGGGLAFSAGLGCIGRARGAED